MNRKIGALLAVLVLAAAASGAARASSPDTIYVECFDLGGIAWMVPQELVDDFGPSSCQPLATQVSAPPPEAFATGDDEAEPPHETGGVDVGLGADPNIAPDPDLYATEVLCPDGAIWAVAKGDDFVCPGY